MIDESPARTIALIRCASVGRSEIALRGVLSRHFGDAVYFVVDNRSGEAVWPAELDSRVIQITSTFLAESGFIDFNRLGWQCGDLCYYAADKAVPDWNFAWLVENDVGFGPAAIEALFGLAGRSDADHLGVKLGPRRPMWSWFSLMAAVVGEENVWGAPFPLSRLSRRAVRHLAAARAASFAALPADFPSQAVPNDESFVASRLRADGFTSGDLTALVGRDAFKLFSTGMPILPQELDHPVNSRRIAHPVRSGRDFLAKLKKLNVEAFGRARDRVISTVGAEIWTQETGLAPDAGPLRSMTEADRRQFKRTRARLAAETGTKPTAKAVRQALKAQSKGQGRGTAPDDSPRAARIAARRARRAARKAPEPPAI